VADPLKTVLIVLVCWLWIVEVAAQELTPRVYWPAPKGTKILVAGYSNLAGDVLIDRSLPVDDVDSRLNIGVLAYVQSLGLLGRSSNLIVELPYAQGTTTGFYEQEPVRRDLAGFGDMSVALTFNLSGAPSMNLEEFRELRANPRPILGMKFKLVAPTGNYDTDKLVNVGANRWAASVQLGTIIPIKPRWLLEMSVGAWFFDNDNEFLTGNRKQGPIYSVQANLIKRVKPGFWASLDLTYFTGGRQTIAGDRLDDEQRNVKIGGSLVIPFQRRHAIKFGYANGAVTKNGSDFNQFIVSYQVLL
jgi:hypothetical protein